MIDDAVQRDLAIPDRDWRVFPPATIRSTISAPSGELAQVSLGTAERGRFVLVPGATGSKEDFLLMLPLLADAGYLVESFDIAGQYESAGAGPGNLVPPRAHYDRRLYLDDLIAVLEQGQTPAHVLGYSFAGLIAQQALAERPDLFASLTLLSTPPASGQVFRGVKGIGAFSGLFGPHVGAGLMLWGIRNNLNRVSPGRLAFVRERFAMTRRDSVDDIIGLMMCTPDVAEAVARADIPKLVAVGAHDLWPAAQHEAYARRIEAEVCVYESGHSPCETSPHQLVRDMLRLIAHD